MDHFQQCNDLNAGRCAWCGDDALYCQYHDNEWGRPVHDDVKLFELMVLEGAQAGLSWITILRRREGYRRAFKGLDPRVVASMGEEDVEKLMLDHGIIRNRAKICSAITNARHFLKIVEEYGSFERYILRFFPDGKRIDNHPRRLVDVPASTAISTAISNDLKRRGFKFFGPTVCYAFLQSAGFVNDHLEGCHTRLVHMLGVLIIFMSMALAVGAQVKPSAIISDGMIVQRDKPLTLWGTALPQQEFKVIVDDNIAEAVEVKADALGCWRVEMPPLTIGVSHKLRIDDNVINNVQVGDVLLCSGQSNMELPVARVMDMFDEEILSYKNSDIRQFFVPLEFKFDAEERDVKNSPGWQSIDTDVMNFSALAYFAAKKIHASTGLPVGIVNASVGGSRIEAWLPRAAIADFPNLLQELTRCSDGRYRDSVNARYAADIKAWSNTLNSNDPGLENSPLYDPSIPADGWTPVDIFSSSWAMSDSLPLNGSHWFRCEFNVDSVHARDEATLRLGSMADADTVWVNGVKVGYTTYQFPPRAYNVPRGVLHPGENNVTIRLVSHAGVPHFVPDKPYKLIFGSRPYAVYGQTFPGEIDFETGWYYHSGYRMPAAPAWTFFGNCPTVLYNAMIAPVIDYPVAAVVWYQGESNVGEDNVYGQYLQLLIEAWRDEAHSPTLPFVVVELANYLAPEKTAEREAWQKIRDCQRTVCNAMDIVYLAPDSDLGEWNDIHPLDKKTIGERVASTLLPLLK